VFLFFFSFRVSETEAVSGARRSSSPPFPSRFSAETDFLFSASFFLRARSTRPGLPRLFLSLVDEEEALAPLPFLRTLFFAAAKASRTASGFFSSPLSARRNRPFFFPPFFFSPPETEISKAVPLFFPSLSLPEGKGRLPLWMVFLGEPVRAQRHRSFFFPFSAQNSTAPPFLFYALLPAGRPAFLPLLEKAALSSPFLRATFLFRRAGNGPSPPPPLGEVSFFFFPRLFFFPYAFSHGRG